MDFVEGKIRRILQDIQGMIYPDRVPISACEVAEIDHNVKQCEIFNKLNTFKWKSFREGDRWGRKDSHFCFRLIATIPEHFAGKIVYLDVKTGREGGWTAFNPQFMAYVDGALIQGLDINHNKILLSESAISGTNYNILLHAYAGTMDGLMDLWLNLVIMDADVERLYYNIKVAFDAAELMQSKDDKKYITLEILTKAVDMLDLRKPKSIDCHKSIEQANKYLEDELYGQSWGQSKITAHCIGHTHIDVAWMWTVLQTREKVQRSFSTVINLMKEYPEYNFMSSQPVLYEFVKEDNPELYAKIKERIKEGRWEAEGGMWLEADCNITSGESLVRQIMFGKRFFMDEFGVDSKILWLPDTFGYSAALPQIMKKSGLEFFMSSKLSWNEFNHFPYDSFIWEGIDGSKVLAYFITSPDDKGLKFAPDFSTYNATMKPKNILGAWERYQQKQYNKDILFCFGYGDGGGGPTREMLECARRMNKNLPGIPKVKITRVTDFFKILQENSKESKSFPRWVGELYFEYHRGTYTTMAKNKKYNRKCELLYQDIEWLCITNTLLCNKSYPQEKINSSWKTILLNQFHDVLPGTSIEKVYKESHHQYEGILTDGKQLLSDALENIAGNIKTQETSLVVFNQLSFERDDIVIFSINSKIEGQCIEVYDDSGKRLTTQILNSTQFDNKKRCAFYAQGIPSKGYKTFTLRKGLINNEQLHVINDSSNLYADSSKLCNKFFVIKFDKNGNITSIFDRRVNREVLKPGMNANILQAFEDKPMTCDAWNIDCYYKGRMWEIKCADSIQVVENGPVCASLRVTRKFMDSEIIQDICIFRDIPRIDFITYINWKESQILLKACFPVDVHSNEATFDIQFGNITRSTTTNTSWEAAQFEVYAHKWADISEDGYGVSLLNNCKYGYDIKDGVMRITLIKSPIDPYPKADKGVHTFTYSLYPHEGDWRDAQTHRMGYSLNSPLYSKLTSSNNSGNLPKEFSLIKIDKENVVIETIKKAEDSQYMIIRAYECFNRRTKVIASLYKELKSIYECSLMEENLLEIEFDKNHFSFEIKPYEIKTFKILFK